MKIEKRAPRGAVFLPSFERKQVAFCCHRKLELPMNPIRISCAAVIAAMLAGCARSDSVADTTAASAGRVDSAGTAAQAVPAPAVATEGAMRTANAAGVGRYLTDANGRALYVFLKDQKSVSTCMDTCAAAWPPFGASSPASKDSIVEAAMVGTINRSDNRSQSTYNGLPLYYYGDDKKPGDIKGHGKNEFGDWWYLLSANGRKLASLR
jgi:predicted lipoprotein with Yx(FWY)xxD motif